MQGEAEHCHPLRWWQISGRGRGVLCPSRSTLLSGTSVNGLQGAVQPNLQIEQIEAFSLYWAESFCGFLPLNEHELYTSMELHSLHLYLYLYLYLYPISCLKLPVLCSTSILWNQISIHSGIIHSAQPFQLCFTLSSKQVFFQSSFLNAMERLQNCSNWFTGTKCKLYEPPVYFC